MIPGARGAGASGVNLGLLVSNGVLDMRDCLCGVMGGEAVFYIDGVVRVNYLRSIVFKEYRDGVWLPALGKYLTFPEQARNISSSVLKSPKPPAGVHEFRVEFVHPSLQMPMPKLVDYVGMEGGGALFYYYTEFVALPAKPVRSYTVGYLEAPRGRAMPARVDDPAGYLDVPEEVADRLMELALNITKDAGTMYEKARAIERYLRSNYVYNLSRRPAPPDVDPIVWFLLESREGVCSDFNGAFVVLARLVGIPARLVAGWHVPQGVGRQAVREGQAHAWAEAYIDGVGWVEFDATAPGGPEPIGFRVWVTPERVYVPVPGEARAVVRVESTDGFERRFSLSFNAEDGFRAYFNPGFLDEGGSSLLTIRSLEGVRGGLYRAWVVVSDQYGATYVKTVVIDAIEQGGFRLLVEPSSVNVTAGGSVRLTARLVSAGFDGEAILSAATSARGLRVDFETVRLGPGRVASITLRADASMQRGSYNLSVVSLDPNPAEPRSSLAVVNVTVQEETVFNRVSVEPVVLLRGGFVSVRGELTTRRGEPLNNVSIEVFVEQREGGLVKLGSVTTTNGRFGARFRLPREVVVGEHKLVLSFKGDRTLLPSRASSTIRVVSSPRLVLNTTDTLVTVVNNTVLVRARLVDEFGEAVPGARIKAVLVWSGGYGGRATRPPGLITATKPPPVANEYITDANGYADVFITPRRVGRHTALIAFEGGGYYLPATKTVRVLVVKPGYVSVDELVRGEEVRFEAVLVGLDELSDEVYLKLPWGLVEADLDPGGVVKARFRVPGSAPLGLLEVGLVIPRQNASLPIALLPLRAKTRIILDVPKVLTPGSEAEVRVRLVDLYDPSSPIQQANVIINGRLVGVDEEGYAIVRFKVPAYNDMARVRIVASYPGSTYYYPARAIREAEVRVNWWYPLLPYLLAAPLGLLVASYGRRALRRGRLSLRLAQSGAGAMPDVVGVGETILVEVGGLDAERYEIYLDGAVVSRSSRASLVMDREGEHELLAIAYKGGRRYSVKRGVRVIEYRKEVLRLYSKLLKALEARGVRVDVLTPREIMAYVEKATGLEARVVTDVFEKVAYGLKPVGRSEFLDYYRSVTSLLRALSGDGL